jgi:hypothetical protein
MKNQCTHRGLRNEMEVTPENMTFSGVNIPWGSIFLNIICPDCGEDLRAEARLVSVWPSSWRVIDGKPIKPERLEEVLARKQAEANGENQ